MASKGVKFNPATDIPSLEGKAVLVTGANSGLGKQASLELARHGPARLWMAARSPEKGGQAVADVQAQVPGAAVTFLPLDLSSFDSIKSAARTVLASSPRLDILMLNAGLMGCPPKLTQEGYEVQMGTNHVGHALLLQLLLPLLRTTASAGPPPRVVSLTSSAWKYIGPEKIQLETLRSLEGVSPVNRYIQSKTANLAYARAFARRHPELTVAAVDPGEVDTQLFTREPGDEQMAHLQKEVAPKVVGPVSEGVKNQLWAATAAEGVVSGGVYSPVGVRETEGVTVDNELAEGVWTWTQKELERQGI